MTQTSPNIFKYATSELSQDAFICWVLEYAKKEHNESELHAFGKALLEGFIERYNEKIDAPHFNSKMLTGKNNVTDNTNKKANKIPSNDTLKVEEIKKQEKSLDISIRLSDGYILLIEDKTNTENHGNQLLRYKKSFEDSGYPEDKQIRIYFKTGYQFSFDDVNEKGWAEFVRKDLLKIMEEHKDIKNQIFQDYYTYQKAEQTEFEQNNYYYQLHQIAEKMGEGNVTENVTWIGWVSNSTGGETMLVQDLLSGIVEECNIGFFLKTTIRRDKEKNNFFYKTSLNIGVENTKNYSHVRNHLFYHLVDNEYDENNKYKLDIILNGNENLRFGKPSRFGKGKHMALFVHEHTQTETDKIAKILKDAKESFRKHIESKSQKIEDTYHFIKKI